MIYLIKKLIGMYHKYCVVFLFFLSYLFTLFMYDDWYKAKFELIECFSTCSIATSVYFMSSGFVRKKCSWFKWSAFGLFCNCMVNTIDLVFNIHGYSTIFIMITTTIVSIMVIYYLIKEFKGV